MNNFKNFAIRTLAVSALTAAAMGSANAAIFFRTGFVVAAPVVVAPAPVVVAPAPVVVAPVVAAPVVVTPVYVPTCRLVVVPLVNPYTGFTFMRTRRVCN